MRSWAPWSVVWVNFDPQVGREQAGRRPAIVIGSPVGIRIAEKYGLITVVPCTSTDRGWAWQPKIMLGDRPGVAMCEQLKAISTSRILGPHPACLSGDEVAEIRSVLRRLLGL